MYNFNVIPEEMSLARELVAQVDSGMSLADILSNALPSDKPSNGHEAKRDDKSSDSSVSTHYSLISLYEINKKT